MMEKSQEIANFENIIEKIIFEYEELEELKIAIKNFSEGKTSAKELKQLLLQCRSRMTEDVTYFISLFLENKIQTLVQTQTNVENLQPSTKIESQLRKEIKEKNKLLETVAIRVNNLVSRLNKEVTSEDKKHKSIGTVTVEIKRCLNQIGAKQWIEMCYYDDLKFFVKLYPKLEELYRERFGESEKSGKDTNEGKEIMANKMVKLGFPEDIENIVINYVSVRNIFQHSMTDLSPSNLELAREVFAKVFVYLTLDSIDSKLLLSNRKSFYSQLKEHFSKRLTGNPAFRREILERLKTVFHA